MPRIVKTFKVVGWAIHETAYDEYNEVAVFATHLECRGYKQTPTAKFSVGVESASYGPNDANPVCWYCGGPVPDEIQALIILRTDRI